MISGQCLCGAHRFELEGELQFNHHCHCGRCRKHHGSAFVTLVGVAPDRLRWERGDIISYQSSASFRRDACATCGTSLPQRIENLPIFVPAGCLGDFAVEFDFHIFTGSKAPWYEIADGVPAYEAFPPGIDAPVLETIRPADPAGGVRGGCLCGDVRYVLNGTPLASRHCHCTRCQRARGAAHASNLVMQLADFRFSAGEDLVRRYKVPDARFFTQCFCGSCGSTVPYSDPDRKIAVIPLGGLDDPPPLSPQEHIWTADIPSWSAVRDELPQFEGPPEGLSSRRNR